MKHLLVLVIQCIKEIVEVTAKDILDDVIKFMLDNGKVFQIN